MKNSLKQVCITGIALGMLISGCGNKAVTQVTESKAAYEKVSPDFSGDSAYYFVDKQVSFGPRVPNTAQHVACGDYLVGELKRFGAEVVEQRADLKAFDGTILQARNIIGVFQPENQQRVLLCAHWDTRPFADQDSNPDNYKTPILGANDAASGVGVLLEVARLIHEHAPEIGVDIVLFDAEDYGTPAFENRYGDSDSWCLGSQYWSKNPHVPGYRAKYGILLDMVGAPDATFFKEGYSMRYAGSIVAKVWAVSNMLGYDRYFHDKQVGGIIDDHVPVNQYLRIPCIDIIQHDDHSDTGFGWYWHTVNDNMDNISTETLKAVGQTVLEVIYKEK